MSGGASQKFETALRRQLATRTLGRPLYFYASVDSTNVQAARLAREGAEDGTTVVADTQTGGKGRLGRRWVSPPGMNLYLSTLLRPSKPAVDAPQLGLLAAVGVARTIAALTRLVPVIKWPNDVLVSGKKVCGVLTELQADGQNLRSVVVGIGVNLNAPRSAFPEELHNTAGSLLLARGRPVDRAEFTVCLLTHLEKLYVMWLEEGFRDVATAWEAFAAPLLHKPITISGARGNLSGTALGLDHDGVLLLETRPGRPPQRVLAGDVSVVDGYG